MSQCVDCGAKMKIDVPRCISCSWKMKKKGMCCWCGERPVKSKQSKYCAECQAEAIKKAWNRDPLEYHGRKYRGSGSRENTYETKRGG